MSPPHLRLERVRHRLRIEPRALLGDYDLEREMQQEIAELIAQLDGVVAADGLIELEHFFYEVRAQRRGSLRAIPRAPLAQVADECEGAPKR